MRFGERCQSWSDATQLKIEVDTGFHNQQDLPLQLGPEATIAYILITPGNDLAMDQNHLDGYQAELLRSQDDLLVVPKYAHDLLTDVEKHGDPRVGAAACRAGASILPILPKCVTGQSRPCRPQKRPRDSRLLA